MGICLKDTEPPTEDAQENEPEPVTLGEVEEGLVFALAGVSQIARILSDVLLNGENSNKFSAQIMQLNRMGIRLSGCATRLAEHCDITLGYPLARQLEDGRPLQQARMAAELTVEEPAKASGVDVERLRDGENTRPHVDLSTEE